MLFSPGTELATLGEAPQEPETPLVPEKPQVTQTPDPVKETKPEGALNLDAIKEAIKADRETQERLAKESQERESYKARAETAEAKLQEWDKAKQNRILDPAGWLRKLGYSDKELALTAEGIMFTLMPEKADPGHRARLVEAQMLRDREEQAQREKERGDSEAKKAEEARSNQGKELETRYRAILTDGVKALKPGEYPASQAWFGQSHDEYAETLLSTARTMAEAAQRAGTRTDLSLTTVAKELEARMSARAKAWSGTAPKAPAPKTPPASPVQETQAETRPEDVGKLIIGSKSMKTAAQISDEERTRRAAAVLFA